MKNNKGKIALIILLALLSLGLIAILVVALASPFNFSFSIGSFSRDSERIAFEHEYTLEEAQSLSANIDAGNLEITDGGDTIKLKIYNEEEGKTEVRQLDTTLDIEAKSKDCRGFFVECRTARVEIIVPRSFAGNMSLESDAGNINIASFPEAEISAKSDAGNIKIAKAKSIDAELNAGNIKIEEAETAIVDNDAGNIEIAKCTGYLKVNSSAGNTKVKELALTKESYIEADMGNITIDHVGDVRVEADVDLGNKNIEGGNSDAKVILHIKNNLGNITVH